MVPPSLPMMILLVGAAAVPNTVYVGTLGGVTGGGRGSPRRLRLGDQLYVTVSVRVSKANSRATMRPQGRRVSGCGYCV